VRNLTRFALLLGLASLSSCSEAPRAEAIGQRHEAIINGTPDSGAAAHESVVLLSLTSQGELCSGSLIAPNLVLTARHCVSSNVVEGIGCDIDGNSQNGDQVGADLDPTSIVVLTGQAPNPFGQGVAFGKKIYHPAGNNLCNHDIALILLSNSVPGATPMSLRFAFGPQIGEVTTPVGYGKTTSSDFSAGSRYRRENTPIVSVGQDLNFSTASNEFVMGQSTCQGDSGGPVLASDTGAILGVTSRGGDCFNGFQQFTRVDSHKALIEQALSEAGATAILEAKDAPSKPPKTKTGEGPCTAGSECVGLLCANPGPAGFCTALCAPGSCPTGTVCETQAVTVQQGSFSAPVCVAAPKDNACESCRYNKCKAPIEACLADTQCAPLVACADACTTPDCLAACEASNPKGAPLYKAVVTCECSSKCGSSCADLCGTTQGTGGAAGAGGAGNAGSGGDAAGGDAGAAGDAGQGGSGGDGGAGGEAGAGGQEPAGQGGTSEGGAAGKGGAGKSGAAGKASTGGQGNAAGSDAAGGAGTGGASSTGVPQAAPEDSSSSGGCSTAPHPAAAGAWGLLGLGLVALRRRGRRG
jgi:MYXO-CTERM domain-containing protein